MSSRYLSKVVVVTGGSKGIGRGVVRAFGTCRPGVTSRLCQHDQHSFFISFQWKMEPKWFSVQEEVRFIHPFVFYHECCKQKREEFKTTSLGTRVQIRELSVT